MKLPQNNGSFASIYTKSSIFYLLLSGSVILQLQGTEKKSIYSVASKIFIKNNQQIYKLVEYYCIEINFELDSN